MLQRPGIVIVNYNSLALVLEAVDSVLQANWVGHQPRIVVVDNASPHQSFGDLIAAFSVHFPDVSQQSVTVGDAGEISTDLSTQVTLIGSPVNGGFASGCNIGLKYLLETDTDFFLLLNPDATLEEGALNAFANKLERDTAYGLVGATLIENTSPPTVQALGGAALNPVTLLGRNLGAGSDPKDVPDAQTIEAQMSYPVGAAMACRRDFIEHAGLMNEQYFLYYEEIDWVKAGAPKYRPGWARDAVVYHDRGAVAGSHVKQGERSALADYHMIRSRMLFAQKWCPALVPSILALSAVQAGRRLLRKQPDQAGAVLRAALPGAAREYQN